jgi:hypothetical protein
MIYLLTCKHEEEQSDWGWLIRVSFDVICVCVCVCVCVILHLKSHACVIIFVEYNLFYDLPTHLQSLQFVHIFAYLAHNKGGAGSLVLVSCL